MNGNSSSVCEENFIPLSAQKACLLSEKHILPMINLMPLRFFGFDVGLFVM